MSATATQPATQPAAKPFRYPVNQTATDTTELYNLLGFILAELDVTRFTDQRTEWRNILYVARDYCGDDAAPLVLGWAAGDPKYTDWQTFKEWRGIGKKPVTTGERKADISSLLAMAKPAGAAKGYWYHWLKSHGFKRTDQGVLEHETGDLPEKAQAMVKRGHDILERFGDSASPKQTATDKTPDKVAKNARQWWAECSPATDSTPYLKAKNLPALGELRESATGYDWGAKLQGGPRLVVPYFNLAGELRQLQQVTPGKDSRGVSNKRFLAGGVVKGTYGSLSGKPLTGDERAIVVVEGVGHAMAISVAEGGVLEPTPTPIIAGMKCFMSDAAKLARELCPDALILIAADLDSRGEIAEESKLRDTAQQIRAGVIGPRFEGDWDYEKSQPDFCDIYQFMGAPELRKQIREGLELARKAKEQGSLLDPAGEPAGETEEPSATQEPDLRAKIMAERGIIDAEKPIVKVDINAIPKTGGKVLKTARYQFTTVDRARTFYRNQKIESMVEGKVVYHNLFDVWLEDRNRKTYEGGAFLPYANKLSPAITGNKALPEPDENGKLNMFMGMTIEPIKGDCQPLLDHIKGVWCRNDNALYDYVIKWIARMFQYPGEPGHSTLCVQGDQGSGKGIITDILRDAWGPGIHSLVATTQSEITAKFNSSMATAIFVCLNEAVFSGDKSIAGKLKAMITDETLQVEPKFVDSYTAANCMHFIFTSNYDWIAPIELGDRRYVTLETTTDHITAGHETDEDKAKAKRAYFKRLVECKNNGGSEAFVHYMLKLDLAGYDPREIPECGSAKRFEAVMRSLDMVHQWWYEQLSAGNASAIAVESGQTWEWELPEDVKANMGSVEVRISKEIVKRSFREFLSGRWQHRKLEDLPAMTRLIKKACPGMKEDLRITKKDSSSGQRAGERCFAFPDLQECRKGFEGMVGMEVDWD